MKRGVAGNNACQAFRILSGDIMRTVEVPRGHIQGHGWQVLDSVCLVKLLKDVFVA